MVWWRPSGLGRTVPSGLSRVRRGHCYTADDEQHHHNITPLASTYLGQLSTTAATMSPTDSQPKPTPSPSSSTTATTRSPFTTIQETLTEISTLTRLFFETLLSPLLDPNSWTQPSIASTGAFGTGVGGSASGGGSRLGGGGSASWFGRGGSSGGGSGGGAAGGGGGGRRLGTIAGLNGSGSKSPVLLSHELSLGALRGCFPLIFLRLNSDRQFTDPCSSSFRD